MPYSNIDKPNSYFNTVTYAGTSTTNNISVGFKPDFVWIKNRTDAFAPYLSDSVRGAYKILFSNLTNAEYNGTSNSDGVSAFTSTGFTLLNGTNADNFNKSANNYASWNWLGSNTTASNTSGSISSTVSANTTSGFSIVSYTGNGSNSTVGHGLGVAPKFIIFKNRSSATGWACYNKNIGASKYLALNETIEAQTATGVSNSTDPTSSVFSIGTADRVNTNGNNYIAYCFADVKGFSKAFSYTGNGGSDGTFVSLGFRPAWLLIKRTDSSGYDWLVYDNKRQVEFNVVDDFLKPNLSDAETTGNAGQSLDFLSNGIKFRGTGASSNASGATYIGFAIAEQPFVSSKGIPTTAR
jgi:hypothetical protein